MVKSRAGGQRRAKVQPTSQHDDNIRRIAEMIDLATNAKMIADHLGEKFLAYLLAMVILEMSRIEDKRANHTVTDSPHATADVPAR